MTMKLWELNHLIVNFDIDYLRQNTSASGACDECGKSEMVPQQQAIKVGTKVRNKAVLEQFFLQ